MRDGVVLLAPGISLGGAERVAVLIEKHFKQIANRAEFRWRQEINQSVGLLAFLLEID